MTLILHFMNIGQLQRTLELCNLICRKKGWADGHRCVFQERKYLGSCKTCGLHNL